MNSPKPIVINLHPHPFHQRSPRSMNLLALLNLGLIGYLGYRVMVMLVAPANSNTIISHRHKLSELFATLSSPGVIAICAAEGNCNSDGTKTSIYYGHKDPGNFKKNMGFCSDQGRGGGNIQKADQACLERLQSREVRIQQKFREAGLDASQHLEAYINALDLWNQASPECSDRFPTIYPQALSKGMQGEEALVWARVESFRESNGSLGGYGLQAICRRDKRRTLSTWDCLATDQRRRVQQISLVLRR